jgi:hypothetical protein
MNQVVPDIRTPLGLNPRRFTLFFVRSRKRGLDLNFYQKRFCPHSHDYSEILTPGYRVSRSTPRQLVCLSMSTT